MKHPYLVLIVIFAIACSEPQPKNQETPEPEVTTLVADVYGGTGGLSVDSSGNIYTSDFGPFLGQINPNFKVVSKVFKVSPKGKVEVFLDSILGASGSEFDADGNFYQSNIRGGYITKVAGEAVSTYVTDSIAGPVGIIFDKDNNLYICNCGNNTIRKVTPDGENTLFSKGEMLKCPNGITQDDVGNIYIANFYDGNVIKITADGEPSVFATIPGNNNGHLIYRDGILYVIARTAHQVYTVDMERNVELFAGTGERGRRNSSRLASTFSYPNDLDFSPDGKFLYLNEFADSLGSDKILTPMVIRRIKMPE
ncbi:MAG: hypothetical protein RJQ09_12870 [Cyclobacteriaceae bacterium]